MKYTPNYNLKKPDGSDEVDIQDLNGNMDILDAEVAKKVDKVSGKGLSTNDYTTTEKNKLAGIEVGAQKNTVTSVAGKTGAVTVTKADVGLSNVPNYGMATQAQAEAGTASTVLMSPLRTKNYWDKMVQFGTANPTASSIPEGGLYFQYE